MNKTPTFDPATAALATHCYAMLLNAMPTVSILAEQHGVLLTDDALHFIEDTAVSCLIQSAITLSRSREHHPAALDFANVDALAAAQAFVTLSLDDDFRQVMQDLRADALSGVQNPPED